MSRHILHEHALGYALFDLLAHTSTTHETMSDPAKFGKTCKLVAFAPFKNAKEALENCQEVSEGKCSEFLQTFLEMNIAKKANYNLGVSEKQLAGAIKTAMGIECTSDDVVTEATRGIRMHFSKIIKQLSPQDMERAQLGLGHAFSRSKVKFNVNRSDNMILQASALLDELDKDVNTFCMRIREWYSWHFPELIKVVPENHLFARVVKVIGDKSTLTEDKLPELEAIVGDESKAKAIIEAANTSMGTDISEIDILNINSFADRVISITDYRKQLQSYLHDKMGMVAPNLAGLIGDTVGARLIRHAGSLSNLSKYPASTVQILGAEKALFRALKTKGNTPKYGLIYHSTFIGRAGAKNKGRISRYLANKCSIASRIDCYTDLPSSLFGDAMRDQVEERLAFYESGKKPARNADVMSGVAKEMIMDMDVDQDDDKPSTKKRSAAEIAPPSITPAKKSKKAKTDKAAEATPEVTKSEVKDKKSEKKSKKALEAEMETPNSEIKSKKDVEVEAPKSDKKDKKEKKDKSEKKEKKEKKSKSKD